MKQIKGIINYFSLLFRTKYLELIQKNNRLSSSKSDQNYINAFLDLKNTRGTYDTVGFLIYLKMVCDEKKKKCNLIIFRNKILSQEGFVLNSPKEKKFLKDNPVDFRHDFVTYQLVHLIENFNPNIYIFENAEDGSIFFNKDPDLLVPNFAKLDSLIEWDEYYKKINNLYKRNKQIPSVKSPEYVKEFLKKYLNLSKEEIGKGIVTITLRNSSYSVVRNSNIREWAKFYDWVKKKNYYPIFVNDTEIIKHSDKITIDEKSYNSFNLASINCNIRLALYELAYLNTGVACGPTLLLVFSQYNRYLLFKTFVEDKNSNASLKNFEEINGFGFGKQWPFAKQFQKIVWNPNDNFDILKKEFLEFENEANR